MLAGTGQVALALALVGATVRGGASWTQVATELDRGERVFGAHPYANTFKALQLALAAVGAQDTELYLSLAVFPADTRTRIPLSAIALYWQRLHGYTTEQTHAQLSEFAGRQLLSIDDEDDGVSFNALQHNYLLLQVDNLDLRHADVLDAYRELLPAREEWWQLPEDEPYLWDHLIHHLHGAGETFELAITVTEPLYLITRTFRHGPAAAESDLRRTAKLLTHPALGWWQSWFHQHGHLIAGLDSLAYTITAAALRLVGAPHDVKLRGLSPDPRDLLSAFLGHQDVVNSVAFSPDGQHLATASTDGTVKIWAQNKVLRTVELVPETHALCWYGNLLGVAIERSVVVLRIADTPVR